MKSRAPLYVTGIVGLLVIIDFFMPIPGLSTGVNALQNWVILIGATTLGIAVINLLRLHGRKVIEKSDGWYNSFALITTMVITTYLGLAQGTTSVSYQFIFSSVVRPIGSTIYALLAFYIASASYRAFQARNADSAILLATALIVMLGAIPLGSMLWNKFPLLADWILKYPNMAAQRGIIIGSALGGLALGVRVLLGIERGYMG